MPLSRRISSAAGVVGLFAPSMMHLALHPVGVALVDHAAERRRDEDVAGDRDEVVRARSSSAPANSVIRLPPARCSWSALGVDPVVGADRAVGVGDGDHLRAELLHDPRGPGADVAVALDDEARVRRAEAESPAPPRGT